jgi:hypothetical protein
MALQACGSTCVSWKSYTYPTQSCDTGHRTNITCFPFPLCLLEIRLNGFPHHYRKAVRRRIFNHRVSGARQQRVSKPGDGPNRYLPVLLTILCSRAGARHRAADVIASFRYECHVLTSPPDAAFFSRVLKTCDDVLRFAVHEGRKAKHKTDRRFESVIQILSGYASRFHPGSLGTTMMPDNVLLTFFPFHKIVSISSAQGWE